MLGMFLLGARHSSGASLLKHRKTAPLEWRAPSNEKSSQPLKVYRRGMDA